MSRDYILHKVRTAIGRSAGQPPAAAPEPRLRLPRYSLEEKIERFQAAIEKLAGKAFVAPSPEAARDYASNLLAGRSAVASNAPLLAECGITGLAGVRTGFREAAGLRQACAVADVGITSADYALAETGTFVLFSSIEEARVISLLPPIYLAVISRHRILANLDELLGLVPVPTDRSSSMLLITGPSRTADIEQILVRGVHGPGEIHAVVV